MLVKSRAIGGFLRIVGGIALALSLSGCGADSMGPGPVASSADALVRVIQPSGYSPRPATLAVTQIEGAPEPLKSQFMAAFSQGAATREVALTDQTAARYLARGYLSAFLVEGGARLTYVWDIYDRANHRAQRLNDEVALTGSAPDPWSLVDSAALTALATRSANDIAAYLSNTPEALAAVAPAAPASPPAPSQALSFAPVR